MLENGKQTFYAKDRKAWRKWLEKNHKNEKSIWLIIYRKESNVPSIYYPEAVDEALCFGWIDSKPNKRDDESYYQFFSIRNPKSNWSKVNKDKVANLIKDGLMTASGQYLIDLAKQNGTWTALDDVEKIILPKDLETLFKKNKKARLNFSNFPRSAKRGILEWILHAKKPETRKKRIEETVKLAELAIKANHPKQSSK
ncbi:hypothetical protein CNR22_01935 [Sphingobacteriaceae bacterium]|nr:hypothetical protein CNR22_01935 [Sphingobacteriaceae bacterium]